jgi:hypothetical protein
MQFPPILPFEHGMSVIEWTEIFYLLAYLYVALIPCILQTKQQMRSFVIAGWINVSIGILLQLILPLIAIPKPFNPTTVLGEFLLHERNYDGPTAACPSFHVS